MDCKPDVPLQPPGETEQLVAFVLDQEIVAGESYAIEQEPKLPSHWMLAVGPGATETITVILLKSLPPGPVQFKL